MDRNNYSTIVSDDDVVEVKKPKNWPRLCPITRYDIESDFPVQLRRLGHLMFGHCFFTLFLLIFNIAVDIGSFFDANSLSGLFALSNIPLAVIWLVLWTIFSFVSYRTLYSAIAYQKRRRYKFFFVVTIIEILLSCLGFIGCPFTGFMGLITALGLYYYTISFTLCMIDLVLFFANGVFLIIVLIWITKLYRMYVTSISMTVVSSADTTSEVGLIHALPVAVDGGKTESQSICSASSEESWKVKRLTTLPVDSLTVISGWKVIDGKYALCVKNDPEQMYWADDCATSIINNGNVNPLTQVLTVSRLSDGKFAFGVADNE